MPCASYLEVQESLGMTKRNHYFTYECFGLLPLVQPRILTCQLGQPTGEACRTKVINIQGPFQAGDGMPGLVMIKTHIGSYSWAG